MRHEINMGETYWQPGGACQQLVRFPNSGNLTSQQQNGNFFFFGCVTLEHNQQWQQNTKTVAGCVATATSEPIWKLKQNPSDIKKHQQQNTLTAKPSDIKTQQ